MPQIVSIRNRRKSLMAIFLDEPYYLDGREYTPNEPLLIDRSVWEEASFGKGSLLDDQDIDALKAQSDERRAKEKALWLLTARDYAGGELAKRLSREVSREAAKAAAERMEELGLINDAAYAPRLAQELMTRKRLSKRAALRELLERGVDRELAESAVEDVEIDPSEQIAALIERKYPCWREDERIKNRMIAALQRRGFSGYEIREALEALEDDE